MAFLRFLLQVLLGFALGFATAVFLLPDVNINIGVEPTRKAETARAPKAPAKGPAAVAAKPSSGDDSANSVFGRTGGASGPDVRVDPAGAVANPDPEPEAQPPVAVANPEPAPRAEPGLPDPASPTPAVAAADTTPVDFGELCIKPAAWPPIVTLTKETNAQVRQGEEVIAEIPLAVGDKLQVSKVFGDGTVEVRAKGAKFVVHHAVTDLEPQARARLAEISGRPRAPAPQPVAQRPSPTPSRPAPKKEEPQEQPRDNEDLDRKLRSLFGRPERR